MATLFFFSPGPLPRHTKYSHFHSTGIHVYQCRMVLAPGISIRPVWVQMCGSSVFGPPFSTSRKHLRIFFVH